jgi:signal peptidase
MFSSLTSLQPRQLFTQILNFALVLSTAFMLWKGLSITTDSSSPIVVVLSGSMEPAFQRGDLLFLWNRGLDTKVGEIVVYNVKGKDIPIVHRVVRRFGGGSGYVFCLLSLSLSLSRYLPGETKANSKTQHRPKAPPLQLLTKGDNNAADDTELYARGQDFLNRKEDVIGSVVGFIPFVGYVTILLAEYPWLKTVMLAFMGLTVVFQRE